MKVRKSSYRFRWKYKKMWGPLHYLHSEFLFYINDRFDHCKHTIPSPSNNTSSLVISIIFSYEYKILLLFKFPRYNKIPVTFITYIYIYILPLYKKLPIKLIIIKSILFQCIKIRTSFSRFLENYRNSIKQMYF